MSEPVWDQLRDDFAKICEKHYVVLADDEMVCATCRVVKFPGQQWSVPWPCDTRLNADITILRAMDSLPAAPAA